MRVEETLERLIGIPLDKQFEKRVYEIYGESPCGLHTPSCMEKFVRKDGCHYLYGDQLSSPIIGIVIRDGIIVKAWEYTEVLNVWEYRDVL